MSGLGVGNSYEAADFLAAGARRNPEACLIQGTRTWTLAQGDVRARQSAAALRKAGVAGGDRVVLLADNELEFFELHCACQRIGAVFVALNPASDPDELRRLGRELDARLLVVGPGCRAKGMRVSASARWFLDAGDAGVNGDHYEDRLQNAPAAFEHGRLAEDAIAHLIYTSGTTGQAKGAAVSNRALAVRIQAEQALLDLQKDDVFLQAHPLCHLSSQPSMAAIATGASHVSLAAFEAEAWLREIERAQVTKAFISPAAMPTLTRSPASVSANTGSLKLLLYGGDKVSPAVLHEAQSALGCELAQGYGLTETGVVTWLAPADHENGAHSERLHSVGRPLPGYLVSVGAPEKKSQPGELGEIEVRSEGLLSFYWNAHPAPVVDGWFKTGDAGYVDDAGLLFLVGRAADLLRVGDENINPSAIEAVFAEQSLVEDIAIIAVADGEGEDRIHAVVVPAADEGPDLGASLHALSASRLARLQRPVSFLAVAELPRSTLGKVSRAGLRASVRAGKLREL